jgi:DNA helicase HerA-like ATPase
MDPTTLQEIGSVIESAPNSIIIKISDDKKLESNKVNLQIGKYLLVMEGNLNYVVCIIQNIRINENERYIIITQPIGLLIGDNHDKFIQGGSSLPSPTEKAYFMESDTLEKVFSNDENYSFELGNLVQNQNISLKIDGNKFFSKHIAIIGSTGSGKSCTVAKIIQDVVGINEAKNKNISSQKNSHIIIFDIHSEYKNAFTIDKKEKFNLNVLDVDQLKLPYWLMNSEELESLFIESSEQNSHNQISQFKKAVILNKEKHNPALQKITYDTPVYFDINEVFNYIHNKNYLTVYEKDNKTYLALLTKTEEYSEDKLWELLNFEQSTGNSKHSTFNEKVSKFGGFNGEFDRFISRLETKLNDKRLAFLLKPIKNDGSSYLTQDFNDIIKQFLGYLNKSNISIIDLSGIPFEVLSITVSLISRLVFDFAFHYSKLKHSINGTNDVPFMIVCEEAHNYIPKTGGVEYRASKKSIERIAKEGRKYGLSLMVVSQRPSEVSDTIFSQCNNFIALRLTNINDQSYVKSLLPNNSNSIADILPTLAAGQCLVVGDATPIAAVVKLELPNPRPKSDDIKFHNEWKENWKDITFDDVIKRWKKE